MTRSAGLDFQVRRDAWKEHRFVDAEIPTLAAGQVLFRVDRFAFTANNISYALSGDGLGYWRFFPAEEGWGRIPTMGFGDVVASTHPEVQEGTRCFGFYPMSRYLVIEPSSAGHQIVDGAAHREGLALAYAQYGRVDADPLHAPEHEDAIALLRGLFLTSFLADDALAEHGHHGAEEVLITSASSKTSIALAHCVQRGGRAEAVGLTSPRNRAFVESLGCFDRVVVYDEIGSLPVRPAVVVDMAGNGSVLQAVHGHYGDQLRFSSAIGATHWQEDRDPSALPGPKPEFFFAPAQIQKRIAEWGAGGFQERLGTAWAAFREFSEGWLRVERGYGRDAVEAVYGETLGGRADPARGNVISMWDTPEEAAGA